MSPASLPARPPIEVLFAEALGVWRAMGRPVCFLTGGSVRDPLLGRPSADLDFALQGDAAAVEQAAGALAVALHTRPHLLGREPKWVWRIDGEELKVELWPMGKLTLEEDIRRRDFTCNAIVLALPELTLVDMAGGLDDLEHNRLRAISRDNLKDDPLRLLRAARFLAQLQSFELDTETGEWLGELAPLLASSPRERVGQELLRLLGCGGASRGIAVLLDRGLLGPAAPPGATVDAEWLWHHRLAAAMLAGSRHHPVPGSRRSGGSAASLALLLRAWRISDPSQVAAYSWPRELRLAAAAAADLLEEMLATAMAGASERRLLIHRTGNTFPVVLALAAAVAAAGATPPGGDAALPAPWRRWWRQWCRSGSELVQPTSLLPAAEVAFLAGVAPGPDLGRLLRGLMRAQVQRRIRTPAGARRWLRSKDGSNSGP